MNHPASVQKRLLSIRHPRLYELLGSFLFILGFPLVVVTPGIVSLLLLQLFRVPDETAVNVFFGCILITFCALYSWTRRYEGGEERYFCGLCRRHMPLDHFPH
jgi:cytochrome c biogenesis protein CcdA